MGELEKRSTSNKVSKNGKTGNNLSQGKIIKIDEGIEASFDETFIKYYDDNCAVVERTRASSNFATRLSFSGPNGEKHVGELAVSKNASKKVSVAAVSLAAVATIFALIYFLGFMTGAGISMVTMLGLLPTVMILDAKKVIDIEKFFWNFNDSNENLDGTLALDSKIIEGGRVTEVLESCDNPSALTELMRRKYLSLKTGADETEYSVWLNNVLSIIELDPTYDSELIPLTVKTSGVILEKVIEIDKVRKDHAIVVANTEASLAEFHRNTELSYMEEDAETVMNLGLARLESEQSQLKEI